MVSLFFFRIRRRPISTPPYTLFPYTTVCLSVQSGLDDASIVLGRMAVRCRHFAMRHHHFDLAAQRAFVKAHRLGAVAVEEKVSTDDGHRLLLSGWISARRSAWRDVRAGSVPARAVPASSDRKSVA